MAPGLTFGGLTRGPGPRYSVRVLRRTWLSADTFELGLERPDGFRFLPGQGITVRVQDVEREYSLTCNQDAETLTLCIRRIDAGRLSPALSEIPVGSVLAFSGPHGFFTFRASPHQAVFVATGVGVAPFASMSRSGASGFIFLHGAPMARDLLFRAVVAAAARSYTACLSRENPPNAEPGAHFSGRVTEFLREKLPAGVYDFYLCGSRDMIGDAARIIDRRFDGSMVYTEIFH